MQNDGWVVLHSKESRNGQVSGLYDLLDQLCAYWHWDPSKITLRTPNTLESHPKYNIEIYHVTYLPTYDINNVQPLTWNKEKIYGMFMGRANVTRIRAAHVHKKFEYRHMGLTSFHHDLKYQIDPYVLIEYLTESNETYKQMIDIEPYSDIDQVMTPPITKHNTFVNWEKIYQKIGIEIACETSEVGNTTTYSEKLYRTMLYKRPFFLIAGPDSLQQLAKVNGECILNENRLLGLKVNSEIQDIINEIKPFKIFKGIIPDAYDRDYGIHRVDHVFDILRELIRTDRIYQVIEDCQEDVEHNYRVITNWIELHKRTLPYLNQLFDKSTWSRPTK